MCRIPQEGDDSVRLLLDRLRALPPETQRLLAEELAQAAPLKEEKRSLRAAQKEIAILGLREKIPLSIFTSDLGLVETTVLYLHEERNFSFADIARLLHRSPKSVWASYQCAKRKQVTPLNVIHDASLAVPLMILRDTELGALEAVSYYLREKRQFPFREIGDLLCRHENTIRTAHRRARFKYLMRI